MNTKKVAWGLLSLLLVFGMLSFQKSDATQKDNIAAIVGKSESVPNEILVKFKDGLSEYSIIQSIQSLPANIVSYNGEVAPAGSWSENKARYRSFVRRPNLFLLRVPAFLGTDRAISNLEANANIEYAEKNYIFRASTTPNDTYFSYQWGLNNTGQSGGTSDADIDAP